MRRFVWLVLGCCLAVALMVIAQSMSTARADDGTASSPVLEIKPNPDAGFPISATVDDDPPASVTGEGVSSYTNYGWLSPAERKAFMRAEGYSDEYIDFYFEEEAQLATAITSGRLTEVEVEQMMEDFNKQDNEMLQAHPLSSAGPEGILVETVSSTDGVYATCASHEVNHFGGSGGIGSFKSEIVRVDNYAYVTTGGCSTNPCSPYVTYPTPISYKYGRATFTGSAPYFTFHNAYCQ